MGDTKDELNEEFQILISNKLKQRSIAKSKRDFNTADNIRDELNKEYNIVIDRNKEWSIDFDNLQEDDDKDIDDEDDDEIDPNLTANLDEDEEKYNNILDDDLDNVSLEEEDYDEEEQTNDDEEEQTDDNKKEIELLNSLTVPKLKEKLKEVGLPVSGRKSELIERLINNI